MTRDGFGGTPEQMTEAVCAFMEPALQHAVDRLDDPVRRVARYHFGWVDIDGSATPRGAVRRRVAATILLSAGSDETSWRRARNAAVAGTLMANFLVVHDDVMDKDEVRRGRPTVWVAFGAPAAIQAADALLGLAFELLAEEPKDVAVDAIHRMGIAVRQVCAGQALDMDLERRPTASLEESVTMMQAKTGALASFCSTLGALCAGAGPDQVEAASSFGYHFGMALQHQDDLEGTWSSRSMKPPMSDLRQRKKIPAVAFALQSSAAERDKLAAFYESTEAPDTGQLREIARLIDACGGKAWAEDQMWHHVLEAQHHAELAFTDPVSRKALVAHLRALAEGRLSGPRPAAV